MTKIREARGYQQNSSRLHSPSVIAKGKSKPGQIEDVVLELVKQAEEIGRANTQRAITERDLAVATLASLCLFLNWKVGVIESRRELWIELPGAGACSWTFGDDTWPLLQYVPAWRSDSCPTEEPQEERLIKLIRETTITRKLIRKK